MVKKWFTSLVLENTGLSYIFFSKYKLYKLAIKCDEIDHRDRDIGYEVGRQKHIEKLLKCTFVRFNPDVKDFCILEVVNKAFIQIKSFFKK